MPHSPNLDWRRLQAGLWRFAPSFYGWLGWLGWLSFYGLILSWLAWLRLDLAWLGFGLALAGFGLVFIRILGWIWVGFLHFCCFIMILAYVYL